MKAETKNTQLISKLFFRLLPIQILICVVRVVNGIVSSFFASNYIGTEAMSAIGLYNPLNQFLTALSLTIMGGASVLCGKYIGRNEKEKTQRIFSMDLTITLIVCAVMMFLYGLASVTDMTRVMTDDVAVRRNLNQYILGQCIGFFPMMMTTHLSSFLSLENQMKRTLYASFVYIIVSVFLNYCFVCVLSLSALGVALASSLSLWVFLAVEVQYYFSGKSMLKLSLRNLCWRDLLQIVRIGYPGALSRGYKTVRGIILNMLILQFVGSLGLSAYAASDSLMQVFWGIPDGVRSVSRILFSISYGEEDRQTLIDSMKTVLLKGTLVTGAFCAAIVLAAEPLAMIFYRDVSSPVYHMTVMAFRIIPFSLVISIFYMQFNYYSQVAGKQVLVHILSALDGGVCVSAFSALLIPFMKMNAVYLSFVFNVVICGVTVILYSWIVRKKFPKSIEDLMVIPEDFGADEEERIDISVRSMSEVLSVSQQVIDFSRSRGIDERRTYFAGLFLEEMAGNVVDHGFRKDHRKHSVDIRVVHKNEDMILRIKDDCIPFNPEERQDIMDPKDKLKGAGIRIVYRGAKDIQYQNTLGLNVLTIRI